MKLSCVERWTYAVLHVVMEWLPPREGGLVYSLIFLLGGLLWVSQRALVEFWKFLTGRIPQSQLWLPMLGDPLSQTLLFVQLQRFTLLQVLQ